MIGHLPAALRTLLTGALPGLFGGPNPVGLTISGGVLEVDQRDADATAGEPRSDDLTDTLPFDPGDPAGPYTLSRPPYPGPRRVSLVTGAGDSVPVKASEVVWDRTNARDFSLALPPHRDVSAFTGVRVLYAVTAVHVKIKATRALGVRLTGDDPDRLERAEALVAAVVQLNRQRLIDEARTSYEDGEYGAAVELKNLILVSGSRPANDVRVLTMRAELEVKAGRALGEDEGAPIERIRTPGRLLDPARPVDIFIDVEA